MFRHRPTIILAASVAQKPYQGGHAWVFLQYLLGFRRLGWNVLFLDRLEPDMCVDESGRPVPAESSINVRYLFEILQTFDLADRFAIACDGGARFIGQTRQQVLTEVREAATFINVMGFFSDSEILAAARHRVFFDIDPGFGQMWRELGWHDPYGGYDQFVSVGERIGEAQCSVPTCGLTWIPTRQPVVLAHWPVSSLAVLGAFTSVGAWRGPFAPVEYRGKTYGLRAHEFRKFMALPTLTRESFEVALDIHVAETRDLELLSSNQWRLVDPKRIARDPEAYCAYIAASKAEFMVAKNMYVDTSSGWFSDRSICYLASGKPVLAQDTGLAGLYPTGEGLLTYRTLDEAVAGVEEITGNYAFHARRAREIAEEYFDSDRVLSQLLVKLGIA